MRTRTIFGLFIFLSCCGQKNLKNTSVAESPDKLTDIQIENKEVKELRDKLPRIPTPINFNSTTDIELKSVDLSDNGLLKKLKDQNGFSTFGKIFETEDFITIIGYIPNDTGTPILVTFDKNGTVISSHVIYETVMGDMGRYTSNSVTISTDRLIHFTDSTVTRQINDEGDDELPGTDSLTVTNRKYRITNLGTIEKVE